MTLEPLSRCRGAVAPAATSKLDRVVTLGGVRRRTYWIDYALEGLARAPSDEITGGNTTRIVRTATRVRAVSDYELFEDESMPVEDSRGLPTAGGNGSSLR